MGKIKLFGDLREGRFLPLDKVAICLVNCRGAELKQVLNNQDTVEFSPPVGGM